eukprot:3266437-Rhodomonas_salina.1
MAKPEDAFRASLNQRAATRTVCEWGHAVFRIIGYGASATDRLARRAAVHAAVLGLPARVLDPQRNQLPPIHLSLPLLREGASSRTCLIDLCMERAVLGQRDDWFRFANRCCGLSSPFFATEHQGIAGASLTLLG